jgi:hypothetical protein
MKEINKIPLVPVKTGDTVVFNFKTNLVKMGIVATPVNKKGEVMIFLRDGSPLVIDAIDVIKKITQ